MVSIPVPMWRKSGEGRRRSRFSVWFMNASNFVLFHLEIWSISFCVRCLYPRFSFRSFFCVCISHSQFHLLLLVIKIIIRFLPWIGVYLNYFRKVIYSPVHFGRCSSKWKKKRNSANMFSKKDPLPSAIYKVLFIVNARAITGCGAHRVEASEDYEYRINVIVKCI